MKYSYVTGRYSTATAGRAQGLRSFVGFGRCFQSAINSGCQYEQKIAEGFCDLCDE
jgi:hypothetical protein